MKPYYEDESVTLYHGDCREVVPSLGLSADLVIADPPYGETSLIWDRWPDGWPAVVRSAARSMWCFGSMRMFTEHWPEFARWKLSQDVVWEKHNGTGFAADRFKRVHEHALHFYSGAWSEVYHRTPRLPYVGPDKHTRARDSKTPHTGAIGGHVYEDDGTRLVRSVVRAPSVRGGLHPTEKPPAVLRPLIEYAVPPGGTVLDAFAGSGSTAVAAVVTGRKALLIEADERYCEVIRKRLAQGVLDFAAAEPGGAQ